MYTVPTLTDTAMSRSPVLFFLIVFQALVGTASSTCMNPSGKWAVNNCFYLCLLQVYSCIKCSCFIHIVVTAAPHNLASRQHNCLIASGTTSEGHCSDKTEAQYHGHTLITTKASRVNKPWPNYYIHLAVSFLILLHPYP